MLTRPNFGMNIEQNPLTHSPFNADVNIGTSTPPPPSNRFLLLDGGDFLLLDGTNLLLLE
jgi:hypothetical protein